MDGSGRWKILTRNEASSLMSLADKYHRGEISLPPEIQTIKSRIKNATRNAELFMVRTGAVDENMVQEVVNLKLELDTLYGRWAESEVRGVL